MPAAFTNTNSYDATVTGPVGGDPRTAASVRTPFQSLVNRTTYLLGQITTLAAYVSALISSQSDSDIIRERRAVSGGGTSQGAGGRQAQFLLGASNAYTDVSTGTAANLALGSANSGDKVYCDFSGLLNAPASDQLWVRIVASSPSTPQFTVAEVLCEGTATTLFGDLHPVPVALGGSFACGAAEVYTVKAQVASVAGAGASAVTAAWHLRVDRIDETP